MNLVIDRDHLTSAEPVASPLPSKASAKAVHRRMVHIVDLLRSDHGVALSERTLSEAEHALGYLSAQAAGRLSDPIDEARTIQCIGDLGISLDWVFRGEMDGLFWALIQNSAAGKKKGPSKKKNMASEAEDILSEMETPLHQAAHLARALRMMASSDEMQSEPGAAIDTVADRLMDILEGLKQQRERAWPMLRRLEDSLA